MYKLLLTSQTFIQFQTQVYSFTQYSLIFLQHHCFHTADKKETRHKITGRRHDARKLELDSWLQKVVLYLPTYPEWLWST